MAASRPMARKRETERTADSIIVLVAVFAYIYFFTGLIKPEAEQKVAQAPASQVAKLPLPSADGTPAKADAGADAAKKDAAAPAAKPEPAPASPAAAPAPTVAAAKPAAQEAPSHEGCC